MNATRTITDDMIRELCTLTTKDHAGRHFTETSSHYDELEAAGLITINRPVHQPTSIQYSHEYWTLEVTPEGQDLVDSRTDLHPTN